MKITYLKSLEILKGLQSVDAPEMDPEFNYAVSKNIHILEEIKQCLEDAAADPKGYDLYLKALEEINKLHSKKDKGEPILIPLPGGRAKYDIIESDDYNLEIKNLNEKHYKVIEAKKRNIQKYNDMLNKECSELKFFEVDRKHIPKGLTRTAMNAVFYIIK
jgi:hypothetical protein